MPKAEPNLDKALYDGLQQAKKNPRYYCVIAKGVDVVGLVVQKKPILDGQAQKLKAERKGSLLIQGVCHANGADLTLEVLEAEPSITTKKIKDFVSAQTELTVKPAWSVVPQLTPVIEDDNAAHPVGNQVATTPVTSSTATQPDSQNAQARLAGLVVRYQGIIQSTPALREKLLPFAQAASTAVTTGRADAPTMLDKFEQALTLIERSGQQAPPRPSQGPGASAAPPPRPGQSPVGNQQTPPPRPAQGPQPGSAAPPRPSQGPPLSQQSASRGSARPSLFDRAKHRLRNLGRDAEKLAVFEEIRCSSALDTVGFAIDKLAQDTPQTNAPQVTEFSRQQMELQLKLQQLWDAPLAEPKAIGSVRKAAEVLERQVQQYVEQSAGCQQTLHEFSRQLQSAKDSLQAARDEATREKYGPERFQILDTYKPLLDAAQQDYDSAVQEFNATGELGPVVNKRLAAHDKNLSLVTAVSVVPVTANLQARRAALLDRAQNDPSSDAARFAEGFGGLPGLANFMNNILIRQQQLGIDLSKLARPGQTLTDEDLVGLYLYTDDAFEDMNGLLLFPEKYEDKAEKANQIKIKNEFCQRGLGKLPDYPSICYPVMRFESGDYEWEKIYVEGQTFRNKQFWSTGATTGVWIKSPKKACLLFRIYGKTGKDIATFAKNPEGYKESSVPQLAALSKGEVLFAPGTPFKVMSVVEAEKQIANLPTYNITLIEE